MASIGPYVIEAEIGRGGAGVVFRARSPSGERVAVKLLNRTERGAVLRFEREQRIQSALGAEDGFVPLLDAGDAREGRYLVMPFLPGGTLRDRLRRGALPVVETVEIALSLARSLSRAHERDVVHRDLKPENVLFDERGLPVIADLGLAKHLEGSAAQSVALSKTGLLIGTAGYMPPEQARDAKSSGPAADVFALGAVLHECLGGAPAFAAATPLEVIARVEEGDFESLAKLRPDAPRWLVRVIERALAPDPAARFADGGALLEALERGAAAPAGGGSRALVAGGVLGVAALAVALGLLLRAPGSPPPLPAVSAPPLLPRPAPGSGPARPADTAEAAPAVSSSIRTQVESGEVVGPMNRPRGVSDETLARIEAINREAVRHAESGRFEEAIRRFTEAIDLAPEWAEGFGNRALAYLQLKRIEDAERDFKRALELEPRSVRDWLNYGTLLLEKRDARAAMDAFTRVIELSPDVKLGWRNRGTLRLKTNDPYGAIADLGQAAKLEPRDPVAWRTLAMARLSTGDPLEARKGMEDVNKAIALAPDDAASYATRAWAHGITADNDRALEDSERALRLDPNHAEAHGTRGLARAQKGDLKGALEDFDFVVARGSPDPLIFRNRAVVKKELGDYEGAVAEIEKMLTVIDPDDPRTPTIRRELAQMKKLAGR